MTITGVLICVYATCVLLAVGSGIILACPMWEGERRQAIGYKICAIGALSGLPGFVAFICWAVWI